VLGHQYQHHERVKQLQQPFGEPDYNSFMYYHWTQPPAPPTTPGEYYHNHTTTVLPSTERDLALQPYVINILNILFINYNISCRLSLSLQCL